MLRKKSLWVVVIIAVIVSIVVWYRTTQKDTLTDEEIYTVGQGDVVKSVSVSGTLTPITSVDLSFEAIGTVAWTGVIVGDRVVAGQELIRLDRSSLVASYVAAGERIRRAVNAEQLQRRHWDDLKPEAREQLKSDVAYARAQQQTIGIQIGKTTLTAPIDGIVTLQEAQVGERVKEVGTIIRIIADDAFEIESLVPESDILDFTAGKSGVAVFDALGEDRSIDVHVSRIEPEATTIQGVVYYKVFFTTSSLTRAGGITEGLRSGMSVDIELIMEKRENVTTVPRRLVSQESADFFVTVVNDSIDNHEKRQVKIGVQGDSGMVEIREGLHSGEKIIHVTQ